MTADRFDEGSEGVSTLRHYLSVLWRRKWIGLAPVVLIALFSVISTSRQPPVWEVAADVLINRQEAATTSVIGQTPGSDDVGRTVDTQVVLAQLPAVADRALAASGVEGLSSVGFRGHSDVFALADVLRFTVSNAEPAVAARLVNAYARTYVDYRRELDMAGLSEALEGLAGQISQLEQAGRTGSPLYLRLADRETQLESLKALRLANVSVVNPALERDAEQIAPRPLRNLALAVGAGLLLGLILVALWETLSTKLRSHEEMESLLGMPFLGRVAPERQFGNAGAALLRSPAGARAESVHALRVGLELETASAGGAIMVASRQAGEGRSELAADLAVALARVGKHVVLVDLDVRRGGATRLFGLEGMPGATSLVEGNAETADALVSVAVEGDDGGGAAEPGASGSGRLEILPAGPPTNRPSEVVGSPRLAAALGELEQRCDVLLVDVAPIVEAADGAALSTHVGSLLLVVDRRSARRPSLADLRRKLEPWPLSRLGFAVTEQPRTRSSSVSGPAAEPHPRRVPGPEGAS